MVQVIYPGTFDPVTNGHVNIVERAAALFDQVVIAVARNEKKMPLFNLDERIALLEQSLRHLTHIKVVGLQMLLTHFMRENGIYTVLRGLRVVSDFEYEFQLSNMNKAIEPKMETIFLPTDEKHGYISSSLVKEIASLQGDTHTFVPPAVSRALRAKYPA